MEISIIGSGKIAAEMLEALCFVPHVQPRALFYRSHSRERALSLAGRYHLATVTDDYDRLLASDMPDTVYVALVNSAHYDYARRALEAGKNVILEKPFCTTLAEACDLMELAERNHCMLFEAVTTWHFHLYQQLRQLLGSLGPVRLVCCNYSQRSSRYDRYLDHDVAPAFSTALAGGALMDINIYNLDFVTGLFGEPSKVRYEANRGYNGIDTSGLLTLSYPQMQAVCLGAKDADGPCFAVIEGERGWIRVNDSVSRMGHVETLIDGVHQEWKEPDWPHRLCPEMEDMARVIDNRDFAQMRDWLHLSLQAMRTLDQARADIAHENGR